MQRSGKSDSLLEYDCRLEWPPVQSPVMMLVRTGLGFDAHRLVPGRCLVLGGVEIEYPRGLDGHSDADVLTHAIIDALLGAVCDGDIGTHFPDTEARWKDARSLDLLRQVGARLKERGASVVNVDATVMAERPRLAPSIPGMRRNIAGVLGVPEDAISVKATTVEGMGALGREEGIGAMAVATLRMSGPAAAAGGEPCDSTTA